jgi:hypothetical protein
MDPLNPMSDLLISQNVQIPILGLLVNLALAALLTFLAGETYGRYGEVLSNRRAFARNFLPIALTTVLIITVVKSSLALSLGLVGALSIIRFRTAIKDPQELAFLFLIISIGLGLGADQRLVTVVAVLFILAIILLRARLGGAGADGEALYLSLSGPTGGGADLPTIVALLETHCGELELRRFDRSPEGLEAAFALRFAGFEQLNACQAALMDLDPGLHLSFLDQAGLGSLD